MALISILVFSEQLSKSQNRSRKRELLKNHLNSKQATSKAVSSDQSNRVKKQSLQSPEESFAIKFSSRGIKNELPLEQLAKQQPKVECSACRQVFKRFTDMVSHQRIKHANTTEHWETIMKYRQMRTCQYCKKVFLTLWLRNKHVAMEHSWNFDEIGKTPLHLEV